MKKIESNDIPILKHWLGLKQNKPSELQVSNLYMWRDKYHFSYEISDDFLWLINKGKEDTYFSQPFGLFLEQKALELSIQHMKTLFKKDHLILKKCEIRFIEQLNEWHIPFESIEVRDDFDYIYDFLSLKNLSGNKYHKKKNHVNRFEKTYNWSYETLSQKNMCDIMVINENWYADASEDLLYEQHAVNELMDQYDQFTCSGGILYVNQVPIAYTIGEIILEDTLVIHFEKALKEYEGAYTMIMYQYLQNFSHIQYINREQDMGILGLRKSKLSYHPIDFIKKYNVIL